MRRRYRADTKKIITDTMLDKMNRVTSSGVPLFFKERIMPKIAKGAIMPKEIKGN